MNNIREVLHMKNIREDCPDWKLDRMLTVQIMLDWGFLEGDCFPCMYYDPISKKCCKDIGGENHDEMH